MTIIIFGLGAYYKKYNSLVFEKDTVLAIADNNAEKQGMVVDGAPVVAPEKLPNMEFDAVVLLLAYPAAAQVREQLFQLGISVDKILFYDEYIANAYRGQKTVYAPESVLKIAIVSRELDYTGSSNAIFTASIALRSIGHAVTLFVPFCDNNFVKEFNFQGISVIECPSLLCMDDSDLKTFDGFDFVIVNVAPMIDAALKLSACKPMIWWIHEPSDSHSNIYKNIFARYPSYLHDARIRSIPVYAVSRVAERAFCKYFPDALVKILPYCVKDEACEDCVVKKNGEKSGYTTKQKITFALIAGFSELKQQTLFLKAAARLERQMQGKCRFLLIGNAGASDYAKKVAAIAAEIPSVKLCGVFTRTQMKDAYANQIDVVVCPSLEECLPTVIAEGMMWSKLCICSDNTGMAEYIKDGENGFLCKAGNLDSLYEKMCYCVERFDELDSVRQNARRAYEENFTMDEFAEKVEKYWLSIK